jgi:hypothetical protein
MNDILLYIGSAVLIIWGIAHIIPTKNVVSGFGTISDDNKRIITMEWVAEGLALCFIGLLVLLVIVLGDSQDEVSLIVYRASAGMLIAMAIWTALTGARTPIIPIKICPFVKTIVAILFILGSLL